MKVGLLICDHIKKEYQATFGDYPTMFAHLFPSFDFVYYDVCEGQFPKDMQECEVYLATGSKYSVYDEIDWIIQLKAFVKEIYIQQKYFIGFCFGHQLIGAALGGKVEKSPTGWSVGVHTYQLLQQKAWMVPFQQSFNLLMIARIKCLSCPKMALY